MRRLAAIMFTDMVGYSALTQKNEALALDLLEEHRKILRPFFEKHEGREIETAGDSFFVEFNSAVEATNCAIEIQTVLHERNKAEPEDRHIRLRIGLHIGDVVYLDNHVHGDGVNIAARIEPLAPPGGICVSEDVARQIRNKVAYPVLPLGKGKLKNIAMPMDIYRIRLPWLKQEQNGKGKLSRKTMFAGLGLLLVLMVAGLVFFTKKHNSRATPVATSALRLAVLPLYNISQDAQDEYFADGMTEELISSLSKISGLRVIARTSVMKYKAVEKDIPEIGQELMVGTILGGSVRKSGNKARINVQLIDVASRENIWVMNYDRELQDIFMIQSEIAQNVANELKVRLFNSEKQQLEKSYTKNMEAYEEYLVGKYFLNEKTAESIQQAAAHFESSIDQDPAFALPYAHLAYCYTLMGVAGYGNLSRDIATQKAKEYVAKALEIDETLAEAHAALGYIKFRVDWDWAGAEKEFKMTLEMNPSYATAHEWYALFLSVHSRLDEALQEIQTAYALDPLSAGVNTGLARVYHFRGEYDKAVAQIMKTLELDPDYAEAHFALGMTYYRTKEYDKAIMSLKQANELSGRRPVVLGVLGGVYAKKGEINAAKQLLTELELPPMNNDKRYAISFIKYNLGQQDEALDILEQLLDAKYGILIYMKVERDFFENSNGPRYQRMLKKMGFK